MLPYKEYELRSVPYLQERHKPEPNELKSRPDHSPATGDPKHVVPWSHDKQIAPVALRHTSLKETVMARS
jgi:hypothetical protein